MKENAALIFAPLSAIAFGVGLLAAIWLWASPSGGGMFTGLGLVLGWLALGAGNALSWALNVAWWLAVGRPRRMGWGLLVQGVPAVVLLWVLTVGA